MRQAILLWLLNICLLAAACETTLSSAAKVMSSSQPLLLPFLAEAGITLICCCCCSMYSGNKAVPNPPLGPNTRCHDDHRATVAPMCLRRAAHMADSLLHTLFSTCSNRRLLCLISQVAFVPSLPPSFSIATILTATLTPLTARSSPAASVRPRH
jgi:hypothetical protein